MFSKKFVFIFCCIFVASKTILALKLEPGKPVPGADELRRLISKYVFKRQKINASAIMGYFMGEDILPEDELLKLNILDHNTIKKMLNIAKKRVSNAKGNDWAFYLRYLTGKEPKIFPPNITKKDLIKKIDTRRFDEQEAFEIMHTNNTYLDKLTNFYTLLKDLMAQAIYQTRYDFKRTKEIRKHYQKDTSFQIAVLYSSVVEMVNKIKLLYSTCRRSLGYKDIKFLPYLVIYEKALARYTDIGFMTHKLFDLHSTFVKEVNIWAIEKYKAADLLTTKKKKRFTRPKLGKK